MHVLLFASMLEIEFFCDFGAYVICDRDTKQWPDFEVCDSKNVYHIFEYCAAGNFVVFAEQECAQMFNVASVRISKRRGERF